MPQPGPLRGLRVHHRLAAQAEPPSEAPAVPSDEVQISTPGEKRTWFWKSLEAATVTAGQAVGGATGLVLTDQHRRAVDDLVAELRGEGVEFFTKRSGVSKILGAERRASAGEIFENLTSDDQEQLFARCQEAGRAHQVDSLRDLQKLDVAYFGASTTGLEISQGQEAIYGLTQDGYTFSNWRTPITPGDAILNTVSIKFSKGDGKSYSNYREMPLVHYFRGSGSAEELEFPEVARRLKELEGAGELFDNDPVAVYDRRRLTSEGQVLADLEMTAEGLKRGLEEAAVNLLVLRDKVLSKVPEKDRGKLFELIRQPVPGHTTESQFQLVRSLARRMDYEKAVSAFSKLRKAELEGQELAEAVRLTTELAPRSERAPEQAILLRTLPEDNSLSRLDEKRQIELLRSLEGVFRSGRDTEQIFLKMGRRSGAEELADHVTMLNHVGMIMSSPRESFFSGHDFDRVEEALNTTGRSPAEVVEVLQGAGRRNLAQGKPDQIMPETLFILSGGRPEEWATAVAGLESVFSIRGLPAKSWSECIFELAVKHPEADTLLRTSELLNLTAENAVFGKEHISKHEMQREMEKVVERVTQHPDLSPQDLAGIVTGQEATRVKHGEDYLEVGSFQVAIES